MAVYRRGGTWWYEFIIAGKRVRESAKTSRKTLAIEAEKQHRLRLERALSGLPSEAPVERIASVGERIKGYLEHYPSAHREKSVVFATQRLAHVKRLLGSCLLCDLTEARVREYIQTRLREEAGGRTINMEVGELSRAIGVKWSGAWPNVRKLEENHDVGQALSADEETRLLRAAASDNSPNRNPLLYPFLKLALATGMRSGEIMTLRWGQIDLSGEIITVGKAKTKAGSGRQIPMNPDVKAAVEMHASWYADPKQFGELRREWFVFPGRKGRPTKGQERPLDPTVPLKSITSAWEKVRKASGVSCRLHDLRHTAATKMAEAGTSESTMLALLGHMSRAMLERYSHIRMVAKREAVKALRLTYTEAPEQPTSNGLPTKTPTTSPSVSIQ